MNSKKNINMSKKKKRNYLMCINKAKASPLQPLGDLSRAPH